ncbi:hypothetical protein [uncultured Cytophaga sp.]|uniref:hypothetical protein n=1 Tax=uncultured Cytophaga sp. TaxID=160238 RepID=UPI0026031741|nr:hypothetical protein [uncultured Cytophaga sp.]
MSKLKNIIKQLSTKDYTAIYDSLINSNAEKSAYLLKFMREKQLSDTRIMEELEVNNNAYYTLRSRLNQKIEEYLLQEMESPRTSLIKKVATVHDIIFTKKRAIAIASLKKLEKELLDYDLSNELTIIYKTLKKLLLNSPEDHFNYSQLYNRHVAYMLALDKAEDMLGNYFKKYGEYFLTGSETDKLGLELLQSEMNNIANLYQSHRLYVFQSFINLFHELKIKKVANPEMEQTFESIQNIFDQYYLDAIYYHLILVLDYLKVEYYSMVNNSTVLNKSIDDITESIPIFVSNYSLYTFSPGILLAKQKHYIGDRTEKMMYGDSKELFEDYETNKLNLPEFIIYVNYRASGCFFAEKYDEAAKYLNSLLNETSIKRYPNTLLEIKLFLALQYTLIKEHDLFNQLVNSIQRQIRLLGKDECPHAVTIIKICKTALNEGKKGKKAKLTLLTERLSLTLPAYYSPFNYLALNENFYTKLSEV